MKAMRNEQGEMMKNAHLLGFFRRICRWVMTPSYLMLISRTMSKLSLSEQG